MNEPDKNTWKGWRKFFFGNPKRTVWTLAVLGMVVVILAPGLLETMVNRLAKVALTVFIVFIGYKVMFRGGKK